MADLKQSKENDMKKLLIKVLKGVKKFLVRNYSDVSSWDSFPTLTDKEAITWEAIILHGRGHSERVVAERLGITRHAVRKALGK